MLLSQILQILSNNTESHEVYIPSIWISEDAAEKLKIDYKLFLKLKIEEILDSGVQPTFSESTNWTNKAVVYNVFLRYFSAYDHDQDGKIGQEQNDITINKNGIRETGTFLKTIALLPYLKSLGINTIHLLPITRIGLEGRKGDLGSPYAIRNPFQIDPLLGDPIINLSVDEQYQALIEAAHLLGMKVVQEFIFRTASIDSDWRLKYPEWFYWIGKDQKYSAPKFSKKDLEQILKVPKGKGKHIPPSKTYRAKFKIPERADISNKWKIASAFADWPPDDLQPPWSDVTYLRLFNYNFNKRNNFNYIAYNTIRFYDPVLSDKQNINHKLWDKISDIIPYYQKGFGIDGAMIDMGHALPDQLKEKIIEKARNSDSKFAFWDENFDNSETTREEGYNAVVGDAWSKMTRRNGMNKVIRSALNPKPLPFFGTPETHNSPRYGIGNANKKKAAWLLFNLIPNSIPFLHNGFELDEQIPVNTGLNFKEDQIRYYSKKCLPLFYKNAMDWNAKSNILSFTKKIAAIKRCYPWIFKKKNLKLIESDNSNVLGFQISFKSKNAIVLFNTNFHKRENYVIPEILGADYFDLISDEKISFQGSNELSRGTILLAIRN